MKNKLKKIVLLGTLSLLALTKVYAAEQSAEKVDLDAFAMLPAITQASVSKDGKQLGFVRATSKEGEYVIEIRQTNQPNQKPVILGSDRMEITGFYWLNNQKVGVQFRQNIQDGNKNYWVDKFAIVNADGTGKWLVPFKKDRDASFSVLSVLRDEDDEILIEYDVNNNYYPDVLRFNIVTGRSKTILRGNSKRSGGFVPDRDGDIRAAFGFNPADNSRDLYARAKGDSEWKLVKQLFATDRENYDFIGFSTDNDDEIYVNANLGEDKTGIYLYNIKTGKYSERLFGIGKVDTDGIIVSGKKETRGKLLGFRYTTKHPVRYYTDEKEGELYNGIKSLFKGKYVSIRSRSADDNAIVIHTSADKDPGTYYLLKNKNKLEMIGEKFPLLKPKHLSKVKYISYKARDGRKIPAYVTIPKGKKPYPAVIMPHGGPWVRDVVVYDEWAQLLAHHGYLVIQPQYRGSTGFGLEHWKAADAQWGYTMQDDLDDGMQFLVKKGLANPDRLAMFGWSYGGYAAFAGSMRKDNIYQCTIAGAGVSHLTRIVATLLEDRYMREVAGPYYKGISPLDTVENVNVPILVIHGDIDQRVPVKQSRLFVDKLEDLNKDYKYIELDGADHFSNTLYYNHKTEFYSELLNWLNTKCG